MELRTLNYFLAVAREQNMTEAANVLHVTQPTLSRQMADLERQLGCTLFVRTNRATTLTADGMRLRQRAEEILQLVRQTEDEMGTREEVAGVVRIGAGQTQAMRVLTDAFAELRRDHPRVTCELYTGNADAVEERLERGLVDFALMLEPVDVEKYDHLELPTRDTVGVVVGTHGPWGRLDAVTPDVLARMPLLVSSRTTHRSYDLAAWSGGTVSPADLNVVGTFDLIGNAALLAEAGTACVLGISHLLELQTSRLRFLPLEPALTTGSVVAWKRHRLFSPACQAFLEQLRATLAE
ncbi:MAG: LysR family transcriptional regulator [Parafannyhessea sp.]|uniref:LysR family transcriptional regulator n=1 Tax=Parafannyhessea sp. TaxID=2847324 RepID=UPI003F0632E3